MKIYDISQEVFGCEVYEGDPTPKRETIRSINSGDAYNLTAFSMCAHNGTHVDAPCHFIKNGKGVDEIPLEKFVGFCYVANHKGDITRADVLNILEKAKNAQPNAAKRILLKGKCVVTSEAARVFAENEIFLVGNESQTVGDENAPMEVHKILLNKEIVLLEGIRLNAVPEGIYFLNAAPLKMENADGAPTRAILMDFE